MIRNPHTKNKEIIIINFIYPYTSLINFKNQSKISLSVYNDLVVSDVKIKTLI